MAAWWKFIFSLSACDWLCYEWTYIDGAAHQCTHRVLCLKPSEQVTWKFMFPSQVDAVTDSTGEVNKSVVCHSTFQSFVWTKQPAITSKQLIFTSTNSYTLTQLTSSSWWPTHSRALPYWRLVANAKYPYLLPTCYMDPKILRLNIAAYKK